jgi:hypothetical protein
VIGAVTAEADLSANAEPITPADNAEPADSDAPGDDRLLGDSGDDTVRGGEGNDLILGGAGNDRLYGQAGNDRLRGGSGADLVEGGPGVDHLAGNSGKDTVNGDAADSTANRPPVVNPIRPVDPPVSNPNASSIDELLAIVQPGITLPNPRPDTGTGTSGGTPVAVPVLPVVAPFEGSIAAAPVQAGVGGSGSAAVGPSGTVLPSDSSNLTNVPVLTGHSPNPISAQIDLVLQGALLTEATSDAPGQDQNGISKKERRRPTFLYIKPIPLPDLVPDIQLPLPG